MKSKKIMLSVMLSAVILSGQAFADDEVDVDKEIQKPLLEEISEYRQKMQHENVRVQYLEAKKRRLELELDIETVGDTVPLPVISNSTSFSEVDAMPIGPSSSTGAGTDTVMPPSGVASWGVQGYPLINDPMFNNTPPVKPEPKIRLIEVVGFSDALKAIISVNGRKFTVKNGETVRGTKIDIIKIHHDFIEVAVDGKTKTVDFNSRSSNDSLPQGDVALEPQGYMSGDTSFTPGMSFPSMDDNGMQPLPVSNP